MPTTCFFLKTYSPEIELSKYAIRSIASYCTSEYEIIVFTDTIQEESVYRNNLSSDLPITVNSMERLGLDIRNGYIDQQCIKMKACDYTSADYIFHVDSDMVFWRPFGLNDFLHQELPLLPFADWTRNSFILNHQVRALQKYFNDDFFFIGDLEQYLRSISSDALRELGYREFRSDCFSNVLIGNDGTLYRWSTAYPDLLWIVSSRLMTQTPFDTMRSHYIVKRNDLDGLNKLINERYGSIWSLAYSRDDAPVFSEFQIIGNYMLERNYREESPICFPIPYQIMYSSPNFMPKIPVAKYNQKNHPIGTYEDLLAGKYSTLSTKNEIRKALGQGWNA